MKFSLHRLAAVFAIGTFLLSTLTVVSASAVETGKIDITAMSPSWISSRTDVSITFAINII